MQLLLLPAFCVALTFMYWSLPIGCILGRIRFLKLRGKRDDMFGWSSLLIDFFGAKVEKVGQHDLLRTNTPVIYLANHRCWSDFFLDVYMTEGRAAVLSRWAVFPVFPVFLTSALCLKGIIFFARNKVVDKNAFNEWLEKRVTNSPLPGLVVYPEGHRSLKPESLPLKRGMLHFVYSRKWPVQIVITRGKEQLLSEKKISVGFNASLSCGYSEPIHSKDFSNFEQFMAKVQSVWASTWKQVYQSDGTGGPLQPQGEGTLVYPLAMKTQQAVIGLLSIVIFVLLIVLSWNVLLMSMTTLCLGILIVSACAASCQLAKL